MSLHAEILEHHSAWPIIEETAVGNSNDCQGNSKRDPGYVMLAARGTSDNAGR